MTLVPAPPQTDQSQIVTGACSTFQNKPWRGRLWGGAGDHKDTLHTQGLISLWPTPPELSGVSFLIRWQ